MRFLITLLAALASTGAFAQIVGEAPPPELAADVAGANARLLIGGTGPYKASMLSDPILPTHTLYVPRDLKAATAKGKLPIIAWGNGACANIGNRFRYYLTEIASHGYLILATGPAGPPVVEWKVNLNPADTRPPSERPAPSEASRLNEAIDWAIMENARRGSAYYGKLNPRAVAVMGQSCGGLQAISAAADPRVKTLMVMNSGTFPEGTAPLRGTGDATKASLKNIHIPAAWISGDSSDIAYKNAEADFEAVNHFPIFRAWMHGVGHSDSYRRPSGGPFAPVATAWLDWQLKGSRDAARMFRGKGCALCKDARWVVKSKGIR
jgi:dienelactone hydrolase